MNTYNPHTYCPRIARKLLNSTVLVILWLFTTSLYGQNYQQIMTKETPFEMEPLEIFIFPQRRFPITQYEGKEGGEFDNTKAIAQAIEACHKAKGGLVVIPPGTWLTGPIHLKSFVNLHLEEGAVLLFKDDPKTYLPAVKSSWEGMECYNYSPFIYAYDCYNIAITGKGTLEAKMEGWKTWFDSTPKQYEALKELYQKASTNVAVEERQMAKEGYNLRPQLIHLNRCNGIELGNFKVRNSPFWTIHLYLSKKAWIHSLDVYAHGHNNDGIDIEMSQDVVVEHCTFDQGDDAAIVIKAGRNQDGWRLDTPSENILIRSCNILNGHSLLSIGSEVSSGIRNVYMYNCTAPKNLNRLFYIKTNARRGGFVENLYLEHIKCQSARSLLEIDTDIFYQWQDMPTHEERITRIEGIHLQQISCDTVQSIYYIKGDKRLPIKQIHIADIQVGTITSFIKSAFHTEDIRERKVTYLNPPKVR